MRDCVNSAFHSKTADILRQMFPDKESPDIGHDNVPWLPEER